MPASFPVQLPANWYHLHLPETSSTMTRLRCPDLSERREDFVLLTTDFQTAGRGQRGTTWEASRGDNLLFGFLCHPHFLSPQQQFSLSEVLALSVVQALADYCEGFTVKWPNDIYWHDQKICGMLLEHDLAPAHIRTTLTGIGINVNQTRFESDAPNPVSLRQITGVNVSRSALLANILRHFIFYYERLRSGAFAELHRQYMLHLYRREGFFLYRDGAGEFEARITAIAPTGQLTLQRRDGEQRAYNFKEVALILP